MALSISPECITCGTCMDSCKLGAIVEQGEDFIITTKCSECSACLDVCPVRAIVH